MKHKPMKHTDTNFLRNLTHNLDPINPAHMEIYRYARYLFIGANEDIRNVAYDDDNGQPIKLGKPVKGKVTIGLGFNMDEKDAKREWYSIFKDEDFIDFDAYYNGPNTVRGGSQFHKLMHLYYETNDEDFLIKAVYEI